MTNHIEELMKAAGAETKTESYCKWECEKPALETSPICHDADCLFRKIRTFYPAFTPAKQLELIKLIANIKEVECFYIQTNKNGYKISCLIETTNFSATVIATDPVMDIALAKLLIKLLKKRELDKSEVKKILED